MKKAFVLFVLLSLARINTGYCQDSPIDLTIEAEDDTIETGQKLTLVLTFTNNSDKDLILFWSRGIPAVSRTNNSLLINTSASLFPEVTRIYLASGQSSEKILKIPTLDWPAQEYKVKVSYVPPNLDPNMTKATSQEIFTNPVISNNLTVKIESSRIYGK